MSACIQRRRRGDRRDVYKGVVELSGFVDDANEKAEAQRIAQRVEGGRGCKIA